MKQKMLDIYRQLLLHHEREAGEFLNNTVTGDDIRVHSYDSKNTVTHMEFRPIGCCAAKEVDRATPVCQSMLAVFWDVQGVVHLEVMPKKRSLKLGELKAGIGRFDAAHALHQDDNPRPLNGAETSGAIQLLGLTVVDCVPYRLCLTSPVPRRLLLNLKEHLKEVCFGSDDAM